jgi:hypothetical protein
MVEVWKSVVDYEGLYEVSSLGKIRSLDRVVSYTIKGDRKAKYISRGRILVLTNTDAYVRVTLCREGIPRTFLVHRIVIDAFEGLLDGLEVDHINNDQRDNRLVNLQQVTRRVNATKDRINSNGYTGVYFMKKTGKFGAYICIKTKLTHLGTFPTAEEASNVYQRKLKKLSI